MAVASADQSTTEPSRRSVPRVVADPGRPRSSVTRGSDRCDTRKYTHRERHKYNIPEPVARTPAPDTIVTLFRLVGSHRLILRGFQCFVVNALRGQNLDATRRLLKDVPCALFETTPRAVRFCRGGHHTHTLTQRAKRKKKSNETERERESNTLTSWRVSSACHHVVLGRVTTTCGVVRPPSLRLWVQLLRWRLIDLRPMHVGRGKRLFSQCPI